MKIPAKETAAQVCERLNAHRPKGDERYVVKGGHIVDLLGHGEKTQRLTVRFASAAKRYVDAVERGDVREMLAVALQVSEAMESVAKHVTFTEVA